MENDIQQVVFRISKRVLDKSGRLPIQETMHALADEIKSIPTETINEIKQVLTSADANNDGFLDKKESDELGRKLKGMFSYMRKGF